MKKTLIFTLAILMLAGIFIMISLSNNDFTGEETEFVRPAISIINGDGPYFYQSEQKPNHQALWHPPMYIYTIALMFKLFGTGEIAARSVNIIFSLLTAVLIFVFCYSLIGKKTGGIIGGIATSLYLINFYVLSSSVLIDIDTMSTFFVFSFVFLILKHYQTGKNLFICLASAALLLGLWNRFPIAILIYLFIGAYYHFNHNFQRYFKKYIYLGIASAAMFLLSWGFYSIVIEPGTFFTFLMHNTALGKEQISSLGVYVGSFLLNISQFIRLFTLPATILIIWSGIYFYKKQSNLANILMIYIISVLILFIIIPRPAFGYPRYFATAFPGMFILISMFLYETFKNIEITKEKICLAFILALMSLVILLLLHPSPTFYESNGLIKATNLPDFILNISATLPVLLFFLAKKENRKTMAILFLIGILLGYAVYFDYALVTHNPHIKQAGLYIQNNTSENEIVMVPKTAGYYTNRKFYINDNNKPKIDFSFSHIKKYFMLSLENPEMDDEFFWPEGIYSGLYYPASSEEMNNIAYVIRYNKFEDKEPEIKIGDFYVYNVR